MDNQTIQKRMQAIMFFILLGLVFLVVVFMWWPFLKLLALGVIIAVLFLPVYERILKKTKRENLSALLTILVILLIILVPIYLLAQVLFGELVSFYNNIRESGFAINQAEILSRLPDQIRGVAESLLGDLGQRISDLAGNAFRSITSALTNIANFFFAFFLVMFSVFFLFRDKDRIRPYINSILPLSDTHEDMIISRLEEAVNGVIKGQFLVALTQGAVATVGYLIFGLPQAFLWGALTVVSALVPNIGTALAVVPAVLYLLITGHTGAGIGLAIWGSLAVGTIDNVISPKLVGSRTKLHPLLVLFSVIGGLQLFGIMGFLLGPIIMAIFVTLVNIYRKDLKGTLEK